MHADSYSRWVLWLKVLLPLTALTLLSTVFLLSRTIDPEAAIPFAGRDIQDRLRDQQVTGPFFSGTTADGDQISFSAETLKKPDGQVGSSTAEDVQVEVAIMGGKKISIAADETRIDIANDLAELTGDVVITTSTGYRIVAATLSSRLSRLNLHSDSTVTATSPSGALIAGGLSITSADQENPAHLLFTNGVNLIYTPKQVEE